MARSSAEDARKKEQLAFDLRSAGVTFDVIATRVGFTNRSAAHKAYQRALKRAEPETLDDARRLELARLDRLYAALWPGALKGDVTKADRCLKISERRSRILGLDAPPAGAQPAATSGSADPVDDLAARRRSRRSEA